MLHVICTRLHPGHLGVRVGDSSWRCEEIVKKSQIAPLNAIIIIIIMLHVIGTLLHVIYTRLCLGHMSVRVGDSLQHEGDCHKSSFAPFNVIINIIIIIITIIIYGLFSVQPRRHA